MGADSAVDRGRLGSGQLPGDPTDGAGVDSCRCGDPLRCERDYGGSRPVEALVEIRRRGNQVLLDQRCNNGGEEQGVGAGPDGEVLAGVGRRLGSTRVHHHHPTASLLDGLESPRPVGGGGQAPVGLVWVGAKHEQVMGAVDVRHRDEVGMAEHETAGDMFGHLVDRRCREDVLGAQGAQKYLPVEDPGEIVNVGVAQVDADSIGSVLGDDRRQTFADEGERLLPCGVAPAVVGADLRCSQPVWIGFELFESGTLGANEPVGEDVVAIAANATYHVILDRDLQTAGGLT